jgi:hypothetical protein
MHVNKQEYFNTFSLDLKLLSCQFKQSQLCDNDNDNGKVHGWRYEEDSTSKHIICHLFSVA